MKEEKKTGVEKNKKKIIALAIALILLVGGTYAWLTLTLTGTKTTRIEAGTLSLELTDEANAISMESALPMSDTEGLATTPYTFTLKNNGTINSEYTIYLDKQGVDTDTAFDMPQNRIAYTLTKVVKQKSTTTDGEDTVISTQTSEVKLLSDVASDDTTYATLDSSFDNDTLTSTPLTPDQYIEYELRLWIHQDATTSEMEKEVAVSDGSSETKTIYAEYSGKLRIEATQENIEDDEAYGETE